jgi:hypothetical protein
VIIHIEETYNNISTYLTLSSIHTFILSQQWARNMTNGGSTDPIFSQINWEAGVGIGGHSMEDRRLHLRLLPLVLNNMTFVRQFVTTQLMDNYPMETLE